MLARDCALTTSDVEAAAFPIASASDRCVSASEIIQKSNLCLDVFRHDRVA